MKRAFVMTAVCLLILVMNSAVFADVNRFVGQWENVDSKDGIKSIEITRQDNKTAVQIYGNCKPTPCIWKKTDAVLYATDVEAALANETKALSVIIDAGFAQRIVTLRIVESDKLQAEIFTRFTDRSNRTNYFSTAIFALKESK